MGFFDRLFSKKGGVTHPNPDWDDDDDDLAPLESTADQPITGSPILMRAAELQRAYWRYDADEHTRLRARGVDRLEWAELLRLHHLTCIQRLNERLYRGSRLGTVAAESRSVIRRLAAAGSPYRARQAAVWQTSSASAGPDREPDHFGELLNPSLTHLGCVEILRVDEHGEPTTVDFIGLDSIEAISFAPPEPVRPVLLHLTVGGTVPVLLPTHYGLTWFIGNEFDRTGRMTRFVGHLKTDAIPAFATGLGVGQQDFAVRDSDGRASFFGLQSIAALQFVLDLSDQRFDERARARGLDPQAIRREMRPSG
jgi:hypothetical protein